MAEFVLNAEVRRKTGKEDTRKIRAAGGVPAVIYGKGIEPIHCSFNLRDLEKTLAKANRNAIIKISFGGKIEDREVILRDSQLSPIGRRYDHIDFQSIDLTHPIQVEVPLKLEGEPAGRKIGGILTQQNKTVRIETLPAKIPPFVSVDVTKLNCGESIHIADIPKGEYKIVSNPKLTICQMSLAKEEATVAPGAEGAEAAGAAAGAVAVAAPVAEPKKAAK